MNKTTFIKSINLLLIFSILLTSCAVTKDAAKYNSRTEYYSLITKYCKGEKVKILTKYGEVFEGVNLTVKDDSTAWFESETNLRYHKIATSEIDNISRKEKAASSIQGFFLGALTGAGTGLVWILAKVNVSGENAGWATLGTIILAAVGGIIGALFGATTSAPIVYQL